MDPRILKITNHLSHNLHRRVSLCEMAHAVNLTPEHFCRLFKAEVGESPLSHLKRLRMERAKMLLTTTFLSIKEVVCSVGASDESHFRRDFKAECGYTLKEYRRRHHRHAQFSPVERAETRPSNYAAQNQITPRSNGCLI